MIEPPHSKINMSIGVLKGNLCMCDVIDCQTIAIWMMKCYGDVSSWTNHIRIKCPFNNNIQGPPFTSYTPIGYVLDGELLVCQKNNKKNALVCNQSYFQIDGAYNVIPYMPSFRSLKNILGDNVEVQNIESRHTEVLMMSITPIKEKVKVPEGGDAVKSD